MNIRRLSIALFLSLTVCAALSFSTRAGNPGEDGTQKLKSMLDELDHKVDQADKSMVAHPTFIKELRTLIKKYRLSLREVFLFDDFSDGDYADNPNWTVLKGHFTLIPENRLLSRLTPQRPVAQQRASDKPRDKGEEVVGIILDEIFRKQNKKERSDQKYPPQETAEEASIQTLARIPSDFEIDLSLRSESDWGRMEIVLLGGKSSVPYYRLVYQAAPSIERPIEIIRERNGRQYIIESATEYPELDDGKIHKIQWIRNRQGTVSVLVDGQEILSTVELFYKDDFTGLELINRGGVFEWGPIKVMRALMTTQPKE